MKRTPQPDVRPWQPIPKEEKVWYRTFAPWVWSTWYEGTPFGSLWIWLCIPRGYGLNLASVPRWAWSIIGLTPDGVLRGGATAHDWLYDHAGRLPRYSLWCASGPDAEPQPVPGEIASLTLDREFADRLFHRIVREQGLDPVRLKLTHQILRAFGKKHWGSMNPHAYDGIEMNTLPKTAELLKRMTYNQIVF